MFRCNSYCGGNAPYPELEAVNAFGFDDLALQICLLLAGILIFIALTFISYKKACNDFEKIDL